MRWYEDAGLAPELRSSFAPDMMPDAVAEAGLNAMHNDAMIAVSDFFARSALFLDFDADRPVSFGYLELGKLLCMQFNDDDDDDD